MDECEYKPQPEDICLGWFSTIKSELQSASTSLSSFMQTNLYRDGFCVINTNDEYSVADFLMTTLYISVPVPAKL